MDHISRVSVTHSPTTATTIISIIIITLNGLPPSQIGQMHFIHSCLVYMCNRWLASSQSTYHAMQGQEREKRNPCNQTEANIHKQMGFSGRSQVRFMAISSSIFQNYYKIVPRPPIHSIVRITVHISFEALKHLFWTLNSAPYSDELLWLLLLSITSISCGH